MKENIIGPRKVEKPLVLYGKGKLGQLATEVFDSLNVPIAAYADKDSPVSSPFLKRNGLIAVCVATEPYTPICDTLAADGWADIVPVYDIIEAYPECGIQNGWFAGKLTKEDNSGIEYVLLRLLEVHDPTSRYHYFQHRLWHTDRKEYPLKCRPVKPRRSLPSRLDDIRHRQRVDKFADAPMKTISIHNEGCELKTLEENLILFRKYRPKLDVTCYHSRDGLWKIEKYCMDNLPDYRFLFRLHCYMGQGAVLYCIPNERAEK